MSTPPRPLSELRVEIDKVDAALVALLNDRARLVVEIGISKAADGTPVYAPHREQAVLLRVLAMSTGPMLPVTLEAVYREIMSGSFALERPLRVGFLGPVGSFTHEASSKQFGKSVAYEDCRTIAGVFEEVARGNIDYGLVPAENSTIGSVLETADSLLVQAGRVAICAEVQLSVCQALITAPGAVPADIREVHSKPEALAQCAQWLATQYPRALLVPAASTAAAVAHVAATGDKHVAAVGSALAAQLHDLPVMFADITDVMPNVTRFLVLCAANTSAARTVASGDDKTAGLFVCDDGPGGLAGVLDCFRRHGINLTHIDKRPCGPARFASLLRVCDMGKGAPVATPAPPALPVPCPADAKPSQQVAASLGGRGGLTTAPCNVFLIEAAGHSTDVAVGAALAEAGALCTCAKVLGTYPRARRVL
jgi:chorismate mutase/prephenate dehydratase